MGYIGNVGHVLSFTGSDNVLGVPPSRSSPLQQYQVVYYAFITFRLERVTVTLITHTYLALNVVRVMKATKQAKAPLVHSEALVWLHACVQDFGAGVLPAQQVVAFAVAELEHVNPKVRYQIVMGVCNVDTGTWLPETRAFDTFVTVSAALLAGEMGGKNVGSD